jgi:hypothetical protein
VGLYPKPLTSKSISPFLQPSFSPRDYGKLSDSPKFLLATSYKVRAGRSGDRIPVGVRFSTPVQTGPGVHSDSCVMYKDRVSFPEVKWPRRGNDHLPHLAPRSKKAYSYISNPHWAFMDCSGVNLPLYLKRLPLLLPLLLPVVA